MDIDDIRAAWNEVKTHLINMLSPGEPMKAVRDNATVVMLVGPTGSGKTSTAARLAFHHSIEKKIAGHSDFDRYLPRRFARAVEARYRA